MLVAGGMISCSSDYLDEPPIDTIADTTIGESVEGLRAALYGACEAMYMGNYNDAIRMPNGEGYFQTFYGDSPTPDFSDTWLYGYQYETQAWVMMRKDNSTGTYWPWMYGYNLIRQANVILREAENVPGNEQEVAFIKAQALTLRAHGYIRLVQCYGPRFEDSNNGAELTCVLRLDTSTDSDSPLVSYAEVVKQIYDDLDKALELYNESGMDRLYGFEPNANIAMGLYSRIALINHDWDKAQKMAHDGRQGYPIMSADEYKAGFAEHNGEWLWYNDPNKDYNGYHSWGASFSCNGAYATSYEWSGAGTISYKFYKEVYDKHNDDVRCELFFTPDKATKWVNTGVKTEDFWKSKNILTSRLTCYGISENMSACASLWISKMTPAGFSGGYGVETITEEEAGNLVKRKKWFADKKIKGTNRLPFGAQAKFWSNISELGDAEHPFLRAAELLLNEAEAALEAGDEPTAQNCMTELNKNRISGYTCTLSGDALKDEIRLYRRIELWGEGDTWFSMKRWNVPAKREIWVEDDPTSNNFVEYYEGEYETGYSRGWRWSIPKSETNYNNVINNQTSGSK